MNYYGKTDIGKKRAENQDCFGYKELEEMTLLAVCDGMGGATGGAVASKLALDSFLAVCERDLKKDMPDNQIRSILSAAAAEANSSVFKAAKQNKELSGMGTTLVSALITENGIFIINVGEKGKYRSSELNSNGSEFSPCIYFSEMEIKYNSGYLRYIGNSIRAVCP